MEMVMDCEGQGQRETIFAEKKETLLSFISKCNTLVALHTWILMKWKTTELIKPQQL